MSKSENTLVALEAALERILSGNPKRIPTTRKLSVRAIEEEANLGNGSGYYYPEFVQKVKQVKSDIASSKGEILLPEVDAVRTKLREQKRIKENYKEKYGTAKEQLALFAAAQHHLNDKLVQALARVDELEFENESLKAELVEFKRSKITSINSIKS
ncbi:hypothetical protein [Pseudoalteromonas sp. DY56-GL79]|uniref:hypothetical protein n=1 Tax=Pseudoalteromonas sp. DY56-GL79 TaxID=2967131 RepID=UPI00352A26BA